MEQRPEPLVIRKVADVSEGVRVKRYDPETGEAYLYNPRTERAEPWPTLGIKIENDTVPELVRVSTTFVQQGIGEGWIEGVGGQLIHRPGGPPEDLWRVTHTFGHYDRLVLKTLDGDFVYDVIRQPDKYVTGDDEAKVTPDLYANGETQVDWFYDLKRNYDG